MDVQKETRRRRSTMTNDTNRTETGMRALSAEEINVVAGGQLQVGEVQFIDGNCCGNIQWGHYEDGKAWVTIGNVQLPDGHNPSGGHTPT
jgi:hypothetical protein